MRSLQWRHNEHNGMSNYRRLDCLFHHLFRRISKKTTKFRVTILCEGNSSHKGSVTRKMSSFDDVIMALSWCSEEIKPKRDLSFRTNLSLNVEILWNTLPHYPTSVFCLLWGRTNRMTKLRYHGRRLLTWINFNPAWLNNHIHYSVCNEGIHPFPNFIPQFTAHAVTYPCWDKS